MTRPLDVALLRALAPGSATAAHFAATLGRSCGSVGGSLVALEWASLVQPLELVRLPVRSRRAWAWGLTDAGRARLAEADGAEGGGRS